MKHPAAADDLMKERRFMAGADVKRRAGEKSAAGPPNWTRRKILTNPGPPAE
jgi:hypothetical protein